MTRGVLLFAENTDINYLDQAEILARSIKANGNVSITLVTNDEIHSEYFDTVIHVPASEGTWKINNRINAYDISPYDETIVMDVDMFCPVDLNEYFDLLSDEDLWFTTKVYTYRNTPVHSVYYRRSVVNNNLPNTYVGMYYFKKSLKASKFFDTLKEVHNNWQEYYPTFTPHKTQDWASIDISTSISLHILDYNITEYDIGFVHLKPRVHDCDLPEDIHFVDNKLFIGNFLQNKIVHYIEGFEDVLR